MRQETTWISYLLIGFNILPLTMLMSCDETTEYRIDGNFIFKNETEYEVSISFMSHDYSDTTEILNIEPNSQSSFTSIAPGRKKVTLDNCECDAFLQSEVWCDHPIILRFNDEKCLSYESQGNPIYDLSNYEQAQTDSYDFEFTYLITEAMYQEAEVCE